MVQRPGGPADARSGKYEWCERRPRAQPGPLGNVLVMTLRLAVIGGGNMGGALLGGLLSAGWAEASEVAVVEVLTAKHEVLRSRFPGVLVVDGVDGLGLVEAAVIAVKPPDVAAAVHAAAAHGAGRLLSIAAGVTIAAIEDAAKTPVSVVRAMPNTPALVGAGVSAIAPGSRASAADLEWARSILASVGTVVDVTEAQLDAVTGLSGSGPAYLFLVVEALIEGGVLAGLPRDVSRALATQLLAGSGKLLVESGELPEVLRGSVTSPGGTTAAGLRLLEERAVRAAFIDAVAAATERSRQLGA